MLLNNTIQGFFADRVRRQPDKGWKLVGFPGWPLYTLLLRSTTSLRAQPVSIADITQKVAQVDEHGHAIHVMLDDKAGV